MNMSQYLELDYPASKKYLVDVLEYHNGSFTITDVSENRLDITYKYLDTITLKFYVKNLLCFENQNARISDLFYYLNKLMISKEDSENYASVFTYLYEIQKGFKNRGK